MTERYKIQLKSTIDHDWSSWLGNMKLSHTPDGDTILQGELTDQLALHSLLDRIRDLGLPILLVARLDDEQIESTLL